MVVLGVFQPTPRYLVPVGGMVVGNSMTAAAVALNRLGDEMTDRAREIEATLALGATATVAAMPSVRRSLHSGTIALIDSTKTTGLIFFPGTMVGMLLAGADPTDAVRLQLILLWVLLGAVALSALIATTLAYRNFFTRAHQLREPPSRRRQVCERAGRKHRIHAVAQVHPLAGAGAASCRGPVAAAAGVTAAGERLGPRCRQGRGSAAAPLR